MRLRQNDAAKRCYRIPPTKENAFLKQNKQILFSPTIEMIDNLIPNFEVVTV